MWKGTHVSLMPGWAPNPRYEVPGFRMVFAQMVTHFWSRGCFLIDGQVLAGLLPRLRGMPAVLVYGRHDMSGPLEAARELHRVWSEASSVVVEHAGHGDGGFAEALADALDRLRASV